MKSVSKKSKFLVLLSFIAIAITLSALVSCSEEDEDGVCPDNAAVITEDFALGWVDINHRMSLWEFNPGPTTKSTKSKVGAWRPKADIAYIGGDWSTGALYEDAPFYKLDASVVYSKNSGFYSGSVTFTLEPPDHTADINVELNLKTLKLAGFEHYVVFLNGLKFNTDVRQPDDYPAEYDPAHGYTSSGLGGSVGEPVVSGGKINFDAGIEFSLGPEKPDQRTDMQEAMKFANIGAELHYLIVGYHEGALTDSSINYAVSSPMRINDYVAYHPEPSSTVIEFSADPDFGPGVAGIKEFRFNLWPGSRADYGQPVGDIDRLGEYIREYSITSSFDPPADDGTVLGTVDGYCSNESMFFHYFGMVYDFSATYYYLQIRGAKIFPVTGGREFKTGRTSDRLAPSEN